jgi:hypothetical protein
MRKLMGLKVALLVVCLLTMAAVPATAQLGDPLSLAASGVLLPFFSDSASGFVSVLEIVSPVVPTNLGVTPPFNFLNPIHAVFFTATCVRDKSIADVETAKQAKAFITTASPLTLTFNGLAAIGNTLQGNDLVPLSFPLHTRTHWIDAKTGRLRELEPIILDTFLTLNPAFLPLVANVGANGSIGICGLGAAATSLGTTLGGVLNNGFCWNPLRSAATFVTPQETTSLKASIYMICPTADIQGGSPSSNPTLVNSGVFNPSATVVSGQITAGGFPRIQNRDGSTGFPSRQVVTGNNVTTLRGRIYNDDESGPKDILVPCTCLSTTTVASIDSIYSTAPVNLGAFTVPVWYTELEAQSVNPNPVVAGSSQFFSFTGYWGLEVTGREGTLFHRMSNASLDNLSFGTANPFANR